MTNPARILTRIPFQVAYALLYVPAAATMLVAVWRMDREMRR